MHGYVNYIFHYQLRKNTWGTLDFWQFLSSNYQGRPLYLKMFSHETPCLFRQIYVEPKTAAHVRHIQYKAISNY